MKKPLRNLLVFAGIIILLILLWTHRHLDQPHVHNPIISSPAESNAINPSPVKEDPAVVKPKILNPDRAIGDATKSRRFSELTQIPMMQMAGADRQFAYTEYEKRFTREFNPFERKLGKIIGVVDFAYSGFEIQFRLIMKEQESSGANGSPVYPVLFERLETSMAGISTAASMETMMSLENNQIILHFYTPMLMDMLEEKNNSGQNSQMRSVLSGFSDLLVPIDYEGRETIVTARRYLNPAEVPVEVGKFRYKITESPH